jgi:hypothetical protein
MPMVQWNRGLRPAARLLAAAAMAVTAALPANADIIPTADMQRGVRITQTQCAALSSAVWLNVMGREFCTRYYLSAAGGEGARPVVFLQGDRLGRLNLKTGEYDPSRRNDKDVDTDDLARMAEQLSRQYKVPAIYLARVGIDGSSGDHRIRHTVLELNVTSAALDAIKQRHRFEGFHFIGQSGGALLAGGMLALRGDIGCAVIGSGRLASEKPPRRSSDPAADYYNVADAIPLIMQKRTTRILVVTDPADKKVPEPTQTNFVRMLRQAGGQADQFLVQALDDDRHGVVAYARTALAGCLRGAKSDDITQRIERQVQFRLAAKAKAVILPQAANDNTPPSGASSAMTAQPSPPP